MKRPTLLIAALSGITALAFTSVSCSRTSTKDAAVVQPALTVSLVSPISADWPNRVRATGNIQPWQESIVGSEVGGLKLEEVLVEIGDKVAKGQLLARFNDETVQVDLRQTESAVLEAEANYESSRDQADRSRRLDGTGTVSTEQLSLSKAAEKSSAARLASVKAQRDSQLLRLNHTRVLAPDDGVISSKIATVGAVLAVNSELFRLIRQNRLEWRASVLADQVGSVSPGQHVTIGSKSGSVTVGQVRQTAPQVDSGTLMGLVYVDVETPGSLRAGMFVTGEIDVGHALAFYLPESTLVYRDGYQYVMAVGKNRRVSPIKVSTGRRNGANVEITSGVRQSDQVVASGGSFLNEGDTVLVSENRALPPQVSALRLESKEGAR